MKEKPNYAELEKRIDFTALAGRLGQLTEADNPQRNRYARQRKLPTRGLVRELEVSGFWDERC